jgi:hypothetical protein
MVASWLRSIESIRALKIADLVWKYSLSRCADSGPRTSTTSSLRGLVTTLSTDRCTISVRAAGMDAGAEGTGRGASWTLGVLPPKVVRLPNMGGPD